MKTSGKDRVAEIKAYHQIKNTEVLGTCTGVTVGGAFCLRPNNRSKRM